jgi:hypothetical protein
MARSRRFRAMCVIQDAESCCEHAQVDRGGEHALRLIPVARTRSAVVGEWWIRSIGSYTSAVVSLRARKSRGGSSGLCFYAKSVRGQVADTAPGVG